MLHVVLRGMLYEHGGRCIRLSTADEDRVGRDKPTGGQAARLQAAGPHLR